MLFQLRLERELEQRRLVLQDLTQRLIPALLPHIARIHAIRAHRDERLGDETLILTERTQRRLLARFIAIEGEDDLATGAEVRKQAPRNLDVVRAKGCAARGNRGRDPRQVARHNIRIALNHHELLLLSDLPARQIHAIENLRLLIDRSLRGVEILRPRIILIEFAGTETDRRASQVTDRPDQPPPEPVINTALTFREQAGLFELILREATVAHQPQQVIPPLRSVPHTELLSMFSAEPPARELLPRRLRLRGLQLLAEKLLRNLVGIQKTLPAPHLLLARPRTAVLIMQRDTHTASQILDRLSKRRRIHLHQKRDDIPRLAATKTVEGTHLGAHMERRRALIMERTQTLIRTDTSGFQ